MVLMLSVALILLVTVLSASAVTVTVGDRTASRGDTVSFSARLSEAVEAGSGYVSVSYDASVLRPIGGSWSIGGSTFIPPTVEDNGCEGYFACDTGKTVTVSGTLYTVTFEVLNTAAVGKSNVVISVSLKTVDNQSIGVSGGSGSITIECTHNNAVPKAEIPSDCKTQGYAAGTYCPDCATYTDGGNRLPLEDHSYPKFGSYDWENFNQNIHQRTCDVCGHHEEEGHNYGEWRVQGDQHQKNCADCGDGVSEPHTFDAQVATEEYKVSNASCTTLATYHYSCSKCGTEGTETFTVGVPLDHTFGAWSKLDDTQHVRECACGEKEYEAHAWNAGVVTTQPTHTTEGVKTYTCGDCGATKTEKLPVIVLPENLPQIIVESKTVTIGGTVQLSVSLANNPGIVSMYLNLIYDTNVLELISAEDEGLLNGSVFGKDLTSPFAVTWDDSTAAANNTSNGKIVTFTFKVKDNAQEGTTNVSLTYTMGNIIDFDLQPVEFIAIDGVLTIIDYIPGDVNMDGEVNAIDVAFIRRHLANWNGYEEVCIDAADVNKDGTVNATDVALLRRYLANWDGIILK